MNRRRMLSSIHRQIANNAPAPTSTGSHATIQQLPIAALDQMGAKLLPTDSDDETPEPKRCIYCGGVNEAADDFYCSRVCAINAQGDHDR